LYRKIEQCKRHFTLEYAKFSFEYEIILEMAPDHAAKKQSLIDKIHRLSGELRNMYCHSSSNETMRLRNKHYREVLQALKEQLERR
jgi:ADP-heptose:LPS heptosyltransferase